MKGDFSCSFTYIAQGGTNEEWEVSVGSNEDGSGYSCTILRPSGTTYLYMENWTLEIGGATIEHFGKLKHEFFISSMKIAFGLNLPVPKKKIQLL